MNNKSVELGEAKNIYLHAILVRLRLLAPCGGNGQSEDYEFSLPSVFARSILTIPWVELGDKVTVQCDRTGYQAGIIFHTKVSGMQFTCK